jgi:phosphohistidine phosphatase
MERRLFIIRHGKSSWDHPDLDDIDRPLSERGIRAADTMARRLKELGLVPELLFSSPASRALNTARIMSRIWELELTSLQIHEDLYMAGVHKIAGIVGLAPPETAGLAIFGHNPDFTNYANTFLDEPLENLPTAGVVVVTLESEGWKGAGRRQVLHTFVDAPKKQGA